jgi:hypothetical protein
MANRPLIAETKVAVGSLIPGIPFQVYNEETFDNLTPAQVTSLLASNEVRGAHNVVSDVTNGDGTHNLVLHQIRMKNAADNGLRPSWSAVSAAETSIQSDAALAVTKRNAIYSKFATPIAGAVGQIINSLTAALHRDCMSFHLYMRGSGLIINAKGRITALAPNTSAPTEQHYTVTVDNDDWLVVSLNPDWADFSA